MPPDLRTRRRRSPRRVRQVRQADRRHLRRLRPGRRPDPQAGRARLLRPTRRLLPRGRRHPERGCRAPPRHRPPRNLRHPRRSCTGGGNVASAGLRIGEAGAILRHRSKRMARDVGCGGRTARLHPRPRHTRMCVVASRWTPGGFLGSTHALQSVRWACDRSCSPTPRTTRREHAMPGARQWGARSTAASGDWPMPPRAA